MGSDPIDAPERGAPQRTGEARPSTHTVRPGEHFWKIASDRLGAELERPPSDREVVGYWLELIEANRDRLVDPDDPDLIHPGLELVMPVPEVPGLTSR